MRMVFIVKTWFPTGGCWARGRGMRRGGPTGGSMPVMVGFGVSNDLYHFS